MVLIYRTQFKLLWIIINVRLASANVITDAFVLPVCYLSIICDLYFVIGDF